MLKSFNGAPGYVPPAGITLTKGPVQGMTFVVPYDSTTNVGSSQRGITADEVRRELATPLGEPRLWRAGPLTLVASRPPTVARA